MMGLMSLVLAFGGFAGLALAMPRHHGQLRGGSPPGRSRPVFVVAGWGMLAASAAPSVASWGWAFGLTAWLGLLSVAAAALVLLMSYIPRVALALAAGSVPLAGVCAVVAGLAAASNVSP
jgi:hypothetical protein